MKTLKPGDVIGLIGGGQLGRMLAMAAARLGFQTIVLDPQADCPAAQCANRQIVGAFDDREALAKLAEMADVITYEFENVPVDAVIALTKSTVVAPQPLALEIAQDRFLEKKYLNECGIATAPWHLVDDRQSLIAALGASGGKGILKTRRLGYDGKGQVHLHEESDEVATRALDAIGHVPALLEGFVDFAREVSVIAARSHDGEVVFYDIAENVHQDGILRTSTVPAAIGAETAKAAYDAVATLLHALNYVGVIGVEFFVLADGSILANEFAPRVHNSGHWTEAACVVSQFEQHIRAVAGLPLAKARRHSDCVMENLIGDDMARLPDFLRQPDLLIHLYGKAEIRAGRKMGHVTRLKFS